MAEQSKIIRSINRFSLNEMLEEGKLHYISTEIYVYNALREDLNDCSQRQRQKIFFERVAPENADFYIGGLVRSKDATILGFTLLCEEEYSFTFFKNKGERQPGFELVYVTGRKSK